MDSNRMSSAAGRSSIPSNSNSSPGGKFFKSQPSEIAYGKMRFLITDCPSDLTIHHYVEELIKHNVKVLVRVCEPKYESGPVLNSGIHFKDWAFEDGMAPPASVREQWLSLAKDTFQPSKGGAAVAVHCVAGLGRAPVLVALALMEAGMKYEDVVEFIRRERPGALNQKQLQYLQKYKPTGELRRLGAAKSQKDCCIM